MTLRQSVGRDYRTRLPRADSLKAIRRRIDWGWGAQAVFNAGYRYSLLIPEAYLKLKLWQSLEVWAGRRREVIGLVDSSLSSGSYAWSGNALPLTKIQVAIPDYIPHKGLFSIKGFYAHGWFESGRFVNNAMLHQKALYGRFGKPHWRIKLYAGINHQVMWGGTTERLSGGTVKNNQLPDQFSDYIKVVTAKSLANTADDSARVSAFDRENRIGNHLGTVDLGFEYVGQSFSVFAYRQNVYEDGSLVYLTNIQDGLNGLRIRNRRPRNPSRVHIEDLLLEYLYTQSQGGALFIENVDAQRGRDNYFNHSQYQDGWSRYRQTIGTPFISPSSNSRTELPHYGFTNNNRVAVMHLGLSGQVLDWFSFQVKASYSENLGSYEQPFPSPIRQFSSLLSVSSPIMGIKGMSARLSMASDLGDLYENTMGVYLGIRKDGSF